MKAKLMFFILSVMIPLFSFSQTPTILETQNWIKEIIENYCPNDDPDYQRENVVKYNDDNLMIIVSSKGPLGLDYESYTNIPISKIISVRIIPFSDVYNVSIRTSGEYDISTYSNYSQKKELKGISQSIALSKKIDENDLKNRLIKAFKYLVKENGGQIKEDPF